MATIGNPPVTLLDWAKRQDPDGTIGAIAEVLHESNNVLTDALVLPGNLETGNRVNQRSSLPNVTKRRINQGVTPSKSTTKQTTDTAAVFASWAKVDRLLLDLMPDEAMYIASEHEAYLEAITQDMALSFVYGNNAVNPDDFTGLAPRYNGLANPLFPVISAGGSTTLSSIWIVTYGPSKTHLFFPKNTRTGINFKDYTDLPVLDDDGNPYPGFQRYYELQIGLSVKDPRYNVRIANIDTAALADAGEAGFDGPALEMRLIEAFNRLPSNFNPAPANVGQNSRHVIYMNATVYTALEKLATTKAGGSFQIQQFGGLPIMTFRGFPIRRLDKITNTETAVA